MLLTRRRRDQDSWSCNERVCDRKDLPPPEQLSTTLKSKSPLMHHPQGRPIQKIDVYIMRPQHGDSLHYSYRPGRTKPSTTLFFFLRPCHFPAFKKHILLHVPRNKHKQEITQWHVMVSLGVEGKRKAEQQPGRFPFSSSWWSASVPSRVSYGATIAEMGEDRRKKGERRREENVMQNTKQKKKKQDSHLTF